MADKVERQVDQKVVGNIMLFRLYNNRTLLKNSDQILDSY